MTCQKTPRIGELECFQPELEDVELWQDRAVQIKSLLLECWDPEQDDDDHPYIQYSWRWVNLACISGPIMAQAWLQMVFTPVSSILRDAYQTTDAVIDSNATIFFIMSLLMNIPSVYLLESGDSYGEGMAIWFKRACLLTLIGQWGRYAALVMFPDDFWLTLFPAALIAFGQQFLLNGISKLACIWFGDNQRALAIGIMSSGIIVGGSLGFALGSFQILEEDRNDHEKIKQQTIAYMQLTSFITTLLCGPTLFLYEQRPPTHPSKSSKKNAKQQKIKKMQFSCECRQLWGNNNFKYTFVIFAILNGSMNIHVAILTQLVEPFGFDSVNSSLMGIITVATGFFSAMIFPFIIQEYNWYLKSVRIMVTGVLFAQICLLSGLLTQKLPCVLVANGIYGFFNLSVMTVIYSYATETTYPAPEVLFGSLLQVGSNLFSTIGSYVALYLINTCGSTLVLSIFIILDLISFTLALFLKEDLRRMDLTQQDTQENILQCNQGSELRSTPKESMISRLEAISTSLVQKDNQIEN